MSSLANSCRILLSQRDSYCKRFPSEVISYRGIPEKGLSEVVLRDSVLYPEGGGQPFDMGFIAGYEVIR